MPPSRDGRCLPQEMEENIAPIPSNDIISRSNRFPHIWVRICSKKLSGPWISLWLVFLVIIPPHVMNKSNFQMLKHWMVYQQQPSQSLGCLLALTGWKAVSLLGTKQWCMISPFRSWGCTSMYGLEIDGYCFRFLSWNTRKPNLNSKDLSNGKNYSWA